MTVDWFVLVLLLIAIAALFLLFRRRTVPATDARFEALARSIERLEQLTRDELRTARRDAADSVQRLTESLVQTQRLVAEGQGRELKQIADALSDAAAHQDRRLLEAASLHEQRWTGFRSQMDALHSGLEQRFETLRGVVEQRLQDIQQDNAARLDQMRQTVDDKLQTTLDARLGESFRQVSERLEQVYKGLGEMQVLASGVGDLKRVLANVKTRGTWGEVQLAALLEQVLAPDQYAENVQTSATSGERVEFAIRLPGRSGTDAPVWLPIDAKFPLEDYQSLLDAAERADTVGIDEAGRRLESRIRAFAKDISTKYVNPPATTDFAVMFLPNEGLYADVLRRPGLADDLQRRHRVIVAGPTTLWAILNSLQMGFRTLAIERRSSEVWTLLGAVKTEFGKFGTVLDRIQKNLHSAATKIDEARKGTRAIERKLTDVQELPAAEASALLDGYGRQPSAAVEDVGLEDSSGDLQIPISTL